jgi:hypothetical protein
MDKKYSKVLSIASNGRRKILNDEILNQISIPFFFKDSKKTSIESTG